MSNVLKVSIQSAIVALAERGHSIRQIARQLGRNRRTVTRYVAAAGFEVTRRGVCARAKCATASVQSTADPPLEPQSKCTTAEAQVTPGSRSACEPWRATIEGLLETGLDAQRVFQDLRASHGFCGSYSSVKRFVAKLRERTPQRVWRIECEPGQELQIDFMAGPMIPAPGNPSKRRRTWILRAVLSHSRKAYSEAVWRQDSESFLRAVENAFRYFRGVAALLNLDNLKAAVAKADWLDPDLTPKFAEFCRHYGITPMPCRPRSPRHKGKVERSVLYVRNNALAGREFASLAELNAHLRHWESSVADKRIHGTTRRQVGEHFESVERPALKPLPADLFASFVEERRRVNIDSYVQVARAYYEAPREYIGRQIWVRYDGRHVRLLNDRLEQIGCHARLEPGGFSRMRGVRGLDHAGSLKQTQAYWSKRAAAIGPAAGQWAANALEQRGAQALRSLMALCRLGQAHGAACAELACAEALAAASDNRPSYKQIKQRLKCDDHAQPASQQLMAFVRDHPLVRGLGTYAHFVQNQTNPPTHPPDNPNQQP